jgi:hypothetical protein
MSLSKEDLSSIPADVHSVYTDAIVAAGDIASKAVSALANRPKNIKVEVDAHAQTTWSKYSQGLEGHPIKISLEASRRALRAGESKQSVGQMLTADPYTRGLAKERGVRNAQSYVEIVITNADYKEALGKAQAQKKERQQEPTRNRSR